ncbi:MAG: 50S ribosomal protein L10 [Lentisphaerae bacterium]|jgi:large subunit ribosomal protein L10|nr:50S ribosomal protein L10 [Lentisphaerota bacterium]MBT4823072.1 50S ribosomal protein L10 [Lentisphaerota bacterium]MBT5609426.1 50S ribosomal protein L10 [Lentisphaerota bacterium]MBT7061253.1 50S ribosomal protein L10 [Lentisphaerota bacterium]MBT7848712.1 50S ribosomal protein L10 [Lentisphaerota bacterium]
MRPEKQQLVADIRTMLESSTCYFLVTYNGLTAADFESFRIDLAEAEGECHVVPNRLFKRAAADTGAELPADALVGDSALVAALGDPIAVARVIRKFGRAHKDVGFKLAVLEGAVCSSEEAAELADLPSREVLLAQFLGLLQAPMGQLVSVLNAKVSSIAYVLSSYLDKQENEAA